MLALGLRRVFVMSVSGEAARLDGGGGSFGEVACLWVVCGVFGVCGVGGAGGGW